MNFIKNLVVAICILVSFTKNCKSTSFDGMDPRELVGRSVLSEMQLIDKFCLLYKDIDLTDNRKLERFGLICYVETDRSGQYIPQKFRFKLKMLDVENLNSLLNLDYCLINRSSSPTNFGQLLYEAVVKAKEPYQLSFLERNACYDVNASKKAKKEKEFLDSFSFVDYPNEGTVKLIWAH